MSIRNIPECSTSTSYLDVSLKLDTNGKITTHFMTNRIISISPSSTSLTFVVISQLHLYMVYISQLIRFARACSKYDKFLVRGSLLTNKLMSQEFQWSRLQAVFRKFYGCYKPCSLLIQPFCGPHAVWYVSYQLLSRSWRTDLAYSSFSLS
jgi:hypothetical protein